MSTICYVCSLQTTLDALAFALTPSPTHHNPPTVCSTRNCERMKNVSRIGKCRVLASVCVCVFEH